MISLSKLRTMVYDDPIADNGKGLVVYENPQKEHDYIITVDVARGVGSDYSAFLVFDITKFPYRLVARYKNNEIKPMMFPSIITDMANGYNRAYVLTEVNDIGDQATRN